MLILKLRITLNKGLRNSVAPNRSITNALYHRIKFFIEFNFLIELNFSLSMGIEMFELMLTYPSFQMLNCFSRHSQHMRVTDFFNWL